MMHNQVMNASLWGCNGGQQGRLRDTRTVVERVKVERLG